MQKMRFLKVCSSTSLFLILLIAAFAFAAEVPIEPYGRLPSLENVAISPDGKNIAYIQNEAGERIAYIFSCIDMKSVSGCKFGKDKLRDIIWADNEHVLFITSNTGVPMGMVGPRSELYTILSYNITTGKVYNPVSTKTKDLYLNIITGYPMIRKINGDTVVYIEGTYVDEHTYPALYKLNLTTGYSDIIERGSIKTRGWLVDEKGVIIAEQTYDENRRQWGLRIRKDGDMVEAASGSADIEYPTIAGFSPSGEDVWVETSQNNDSVWKPISFKSGILGDPLQEVKGFRSLITDPHTDRIIGGLRTSGGYGIVFFDQQRQAIWEELKKNFPGEYVEIISASDDCQKLVILVDGPKSGYAYFVLNVATRKLLRVGNIYEEITKVAGVQSFEYAAGDGMKISAFLTLPPGREAKNLPLVVLPHGGPASYDTGGFNWWAQALASQGYAVLQSNYRGSDLGWDYMSAGFGEWGRKMQTDLSDGVRQLVKDGTVDSNRVCIVGASYGGYAALAGATLDKGVYRCSVSVAGISDLGKYLKWIGDRKNRKDNSATRYWDRYYGASSPDDPVLNTLSPLKYAGEVTIPIMLIHGRDDTIVPFEQSKLMSEALKKAGKSVELVTLKGEDHWLSSSDTRLQMLDATVKFLKQHNPPD